MTEGLHQQLDTTLVTDYEDNKINTIAKTADPQTPQGQYEPGTHVVSFNNLSGIEKGYSQYKYDFDNATKDGIIYPSLDPSIFEVKFLNNDIKGNIKQY